MSEPPYTMFYKHSKKIDKEWIKDNYVRFLKDTDNGTVCEKCFFPELGFITAMAFDPNGSRVVVGHSTGLIQMRNGLTGTVICTLRRIQFPPKPVYSIKFSKVEENVCYAACMDGAVYRIKVPNEALDVPEAPELSERMGIWADPTLDCLKTDYHKAPGDSVYAIPFITERTQMFSFDITADQSKIVVGFTDSSIKVYDIETQENIITNKVHKLRLQYISPKLQRNHIGSVCALKCHPDRPHVYASASWDDTLRIWDIRCKAGCMGTFEAGPIRGDAIDINRDHIIAGSWSPTEAITHWDLVAKKRLNIVRVQNRRPDVDGEFIFCCRYWRSACYNRKGKYIIVGGSGTNCLEMINVHNRYIACSYPVNGSINAITSFDDRIAFGGSAYVFNIVKFHDPSHEKYDKRNDEETFVFDFDRYSKSSDLFLPHFLSI